MASTSGYALGLDFGTNSVRALIVDVRDGSEIASAVTPYQGGQRGVHLDQDDSNVARQNPGDYATAMIRCVKKAVKSASGRRSGGRTFSPKRIIGIGVDATASTPLPVDKHARPLAGRPGFRRELNAYAWLWKDHASHAEAEQITELARRERPEYLSRCGGKYSSEWLWSKALHCLRVAPKVFDAAESWVELCDYVPALLTGVDDARRIVRGVCAAGHKAMFEAPEGLPAASFLSALHPKLAQLRGRMYVSAQTSDCPAGGLSRYWARRFGVMPGTPVAAGTIDAHCGAVGAGVRAGRLVKVIGTSSCDIMVAEKTGPRPDIRGVCGVVDGSVIPGYYGIEAGQPAVGDLFDWFAARIACEEHDELTAQAARLRPGESGLLALDWNNGNRSLLVDVRLTGMILGQTLHTTAAEVYRALIEASALGARMIMDRVASYGVPIDEVVNCGGIAEKNGLLMQIYADVTGRTMLITKSPQTCALGAAMFGAAAAGRARGGYASVEQAQRAMCRLSPTVYRPAARANKVYERLYAIYRQLHDAFGGVVRNGDMSGVMKRLIEIREHVVAGR